MRALRRDLQQSGEDFPALLEELRTYLGPEKPGQTVKAIPGQGSNVPIHPAGLKRLQRATRSNVGIAICIRGALCAGLSLCRVRSVPRALSTSEVLPKPHLMVAVQVIAAETDATARRLFTTPQQRFLRLIRTSPLNCCPRWIQSHPLWQEHERVAVENKLRSAIVGIECNCSKLGIEKLVR